MGLVFKIGSLDLSSYVRVGDGEGLDPFGDYLDPQFADEALTEGQPLLNLATKNREGVWPVHLTASSKDALYALIQQIRQTLDTPNTLIEWRDDGSSLSTFYDLVYGRLVAEFSYRRSQHDWFTGHLALSLRPYGHTGTVRLAGTGAAWGVGVAVAPIPSLGGDAPADAVIAVTVGSQARGSSNRWVIAAVLPHASYPVRTPAASMTAISDAYLVGASGAAGSQAMGFPLSPTALIDNDEIGLFTTPVSPSVLGASVGRHRILALANTGLLYGAAFWLQDGVTGSALGPTALATVRQGWQLIDLGVISVDPLRLSQEGGLGGLTLLAGAPTTSPTLLASPAAQINEVYMLPERDAIAVADSDAYSSFSQSFTFDGASSGQAYRAHQASGVAYSYLPLTPHGRLGRLSPSAPALAVVTNIDASGPPSTLSVAVSAREKFTFAR